MSGKKPKQSDQDQTFEASIAQVESIIERIESGEMGLEEQIEQYARGAELLKRCRAVLEKCEQRVEEITQALDEPGRSADNEG